MIYFSPLGKRYDLRSEEITAITRLTDDFRKDMSIWMFIGFVLPIPKSIRDKIFGGAIVDKLLSKQRSIVNVSIIQNIMLV